MTIETKFEIGSLVKRRFDRDSENEKTVLHIMEIFSDTCSTGTQIFYLTRGLIAQRKRSFNASAPLEPWTVGHAINPNPQREGSLAWQKYREDELENIDDEMTSVITGAKL